jgi:hypothetical protein
LIVIVAFQPTPSEPPAVFEGAQLPGAGRIGARAAHP